MERGRMGWCSEERGKDEGERGRRSVESKRTLGVGEKE